MKNKLTFLNTIIIIFVTGCTVSKVNVIPTTSATSSQTSISGQTYTPNPSFSPKPTSTPIHAQTYKTDPCWVEEGNLSVSMSDNPDYAEIVKTLFSKRLDTFVSCQSPSLWKIDGYEILKVEIVSTEPRIFAWILYSVKPSQERSWFFSGNGKFDEKTSWFTQDLCYELIKGENEYHLGKGGTIC
jgi:hypothetical protein